MVHMRRDMEVARNAEARKTRITYLESCQYDSASDSEPDDWELLVSPNRPISGGQTSFKAYV